MYYLETGRDKHTRFRNALALALAVHAALILTISFSASTPMTYSTPQIEVTLASRPSATSPQDARQIAQANQEGSGDEAEISQISRRNILPFVQHTQQQPLMQVHQEQLGQQSDECPRPSIGSACRLNPDYFLQRQHPNDVLNAAN